MITDDEFNKLLDKLRRAGVRYQFTKEMLDDNYNPSPNEKTCPVCGVKFVDKTTNHIKNTCSIKCRTAHLYRDSDKKLNRSIQMRLGAMKRSHGFEFDTETIEQIKADLKRGKCMVCGRERQEGERDFHIDHDHATNAYRGILCPDCNVALGMVRDSVGTLEHMIAYLKERSKSDTTLT